MACCSNAGWLLHKKSRRNREHHERQSNVTLRTADDHDTRNHVHDASCWVDFEAIRPALEQLMLIMLAADADDARCWVAFRSIQAHTKTANAHDACSWCSLCSHLALMIFAADARCWVAFEEIRQQLLLMIRTLFKLMLMMLAADAHDARCLVVL